MSEPMDPRQEHGDWDALAVGWALSALDPEDRQRFAAHLPGCARCTATVRESLYTVADLAYALPDEAPPASLKSRLMTAVAAEPRETASTAAALPGGAGEQWPLGEPHPGTPGFSVDWFARPTVPPPDRPDVPPADRPGVPPANLPGVAPADRPGVPPADRPTDAPPSPADRPAGDRPAGDRPAGDEPVGDRPAGDRPAGDEPVGDRPAGDRPTADRPAGDRPTADRPGGERAAGDRPAGDRPAGPVGDRPADRPTDAAPFLTDRPVGDRPAGEPRPAGDAVSSGPVPLPPADRRDSVDRPGERATRGRHATPDGRPSEDVVPIRSRPGRRGQLVTVAAAAVLALIAGLAVWNVRLRSDQDQLRQIVAQRDAAIQQLTANSPARVAALTADGQPSPTRQATLVVRGDQVEIIIETLGATTSNERYWLWTLRCDTPQPSDLKPIRGFTVSQSEFSVRDIGSDPGVATATCFAISSEEGTATPKVPRRVVAVGQPR